jgi:glycosyltransferase involved in cell wall biosynthesis
MGSQQPADPLSSLPTKTERLLVVQQHGCGIVIAPGNAEALVDALRLLTKAPETVAEMGKRARTMLEAHFTRQKALDRWSELFDQLDASSSVTMATAQ